MSQKSSPSTIPMAFGVDPTRRERYSLRQARYQAIADEFARWIPEFRSRGERLKFLDVGVWNGISMRYIEPHDPTGIVEYHGVDLKLHAGIYQRDQWQSLTEGNLLHGLTFLPDATYDVVICEQVLEHLPEVDGALATLSRVLKPGGVMILGVPIFPPGVHLLRKHLVPWWDQRMGLKKVRGHLQAFSRGTFEAAIRSSCDVELVEARGFRMISGGLLRPLENSRSWWQVNRMLGRLAPGMCTEIQVVARKRSARAALPLDSSRDAAAA